MKQARSVDFHTQMKIHVQGVIMCTFLLRKSRLWHDQSQEIVSETRYYLLPNTR
ncbi:protein of unknown function [Vibrio tapetis subsp. tapetis]|uniref:Uncharacterized protein n=1 Tax=Vibrio tapetis subsp. tapetis TaxID=1671868 RepID=A0A2N8ZG84_9VIBR|nr:protein of unknown function [Vibrio tapetis subsp. tapetis]